jgi:hypothetical protein
MSSLVSPAASPTERSNGDETKPERRPVERGRHAGALLEVAAVAVVSSAVACAYIVTSPSLFNPPTASDPWFYTGFWINFHQLYHAFVGTYYASRLPWIIPGYAANALLAPRTAHFVIHGLFFAVGAAAAYGLLRAHFGRNAALIGYVWLVGNQMTFDAHHWDYWDGALITFLFAALYLGVPARGRPLPGWRLAASGFFAAAAVTTNVYAITLVGGIPILYAATRADRPLQRFLARFARDSAFFLAGVAILVVACGAFARLNGGPAWFVGPQIHAARAINPAPYRIPFHVWAPTSPRVLVPIFLVLALLAALLGRRSRLAAFRAAAGSCLYLASVAVFLAAWEWGGGDLLETIYYFSPALPAMTLCVGALAALAGAADWSPGKAAVIVGACTAAVLAPLLFIYTDDLFSRVGRVVYFPAGMLMLAALAAVLLGRTGWRLRVAGIAAAGGLVLAAGASAYAIDGSLDVFENGASTPTTSEAFDIGTRMVPFLRSVEWRQGVPAFWLDQQAAGGDYIGIQALYLNAVTAIGFDMPRFGSHESQSLPALDPTDVVLLCERPGCAGAPSVLAAHGFRARRIAIRRFASGGLHVWVEVYERPLLAVRPTVG